MKLCTIGWCLCSSDDKQTEAWWFSLNQNKWKCQYKVKIMFFGAGVQYKVTPFKFLVAGVREILGISTQDRDTHYCIDRRLSSTRYSLTTMVTLKEMLDRHESTLSSERTLVFGVQNNLKSLRISRKILWGLGLGLQLCLRWGLRLDLEILFKTIFMN
jgi:hypothetical protein